MQQLLPKGAQDVLAQHGHSSISNCGADQLLLHRGTAIVMGPATAYDWARSGLVTGAAAHTRLQDGQVRGFAQRPECLGRTSQQARSCVASLSVHTQRNRMCCWLHLIFCCTEIVTCTPGIGGHTVRWSCGLGIMRI
jgi:hypothetical protein